ncbi:hypothetical protein MLD38_026751 [Melastoma candidum]|uniref:Uncharacterized protein n=1 Tax=Melastoma candidum TaxID=119954 RepID=A0ACB9P0Y0_9MYRT|nr:hypothetical protein MLD38_026751 [Melastoma candidum]
MRDRGDKATVARHLIGGKRHYGRRLCGDLRLLFLKSEQGNRASMGLAFRKETTGARRGRWSWAVRSVASLAVETVEAEIGAKSMAAAGNAERGLPRSEENGGVAKQFEKRSNPEWNQVFAFAKERTQASVVKVTVKDKAVLVDAQIGKVAFDVNEIPKRAPPDSPLAPQWYRLEDQRCEKIKQGELMLAVWMGPQADEAFPHAPQVRICVEHVLDNFPFQCWFGPA